MVRLHGVDKKTEGFSVPFGNKGGKEATERLRPKRDRVDLPDSIRVAPNNHGWPVGRGGSVRWASKEPNRIVP